MTTSLGRKVQIESQFSRAADMYAVSEHHTGSDLDTLIEFAEPVSGDVVLDVATGAGHVALALAPLVSSVVATDLATGMVDKARERGAEVGVLNLECRVADAERLPFDDEAFDLVTCRIAPHHFVDINAAIREAARVLRPGGRYVVVDSMSPDDPELDAFLGGWCQMGVWCAGVGGGGAGVGVGVGGGGAGAGAVSGRVLWCGVEGCAGACRVGVGRGSGAQGLSRGPIAVVSSAVRARRGARCWRLRPGG